VAGKRGSECLLKPVSNIDFNPNISQIFHTETRIYLADIGTLGGVL